jgi:sugar O-acyltransferase (sialic acid O-acetyltransferase NeuD family)
MDEKLILIGTGAVAAELCSYIEDINRSNLNKIDIIGFLDDDELNFDRNSRKYNFQMPYLGKVSDWSYDNKFSYAIAFADPIGRNKIVEKLKSKNLNFPNIIHPSAQISSSAKIGIGNLIYPNCLIGPNVQLNNFNLITSFSFISHDCVIGNYNFLSTAGFSGNVKVGDRNFFGIRSTVIPSISIGSDNIIQAGMTIDKDVSSNETVFYRFKEKVSIIKT